MLVLVVDVEIVVHEAAIYTGEVIRHVEVGDAVGVCGVGSCCGILKPICEGCAIDTEAKGKGAILLAK